MILAYREMIASDLPAVLALRVATRENAVTLEELEGTYGITPASLAQAMETHVKGWLCETAGQVVGFSMGDRSNGEVQVVAIHPDYEGHGIGKTLLAHVRDWLFSEGHDEIWLLANPDPKVRAHGFYRALGWHANGSRQKDDEIMTLGRPELTGHEP